MDAYHQGLAGEELAAYYLEHKGYRILERRFRVRQGEVDLIAMDESTDIPILVFVEVKYRKDLSFARPSLSVDKRKMQKIVKASRIYMARYGLSEHPARFDVVELWYTGEHHKAHHYQNAFGEDLWTS